MIRVRHITEIGLGLWLVKGLIEIDMKEKNLKDEYVVMGLF
jgi:hypothetical protein